MRGQRNNFIIDFDSIRSPRLLGPSTQDIGVCGFDNEKNLKTTQYNETVGNFIKCILIQAQHNS